jgi:hypothetical protein
MCAPKLELAQMVAGVICPVKNDGQATPGWILDEGLIRHSSMSPHPLLERKRLHTVIESLVDSFPEGHEIGNIGKSPVNSIRFLDEDFVEFRMASRTEAQDFQS